MKNHISTDEQDAGELARFGYKQQLQRSLGSFSSFAIAFSLISISTGIFCQFSLMALCRSGRGSSGRGWW
ncbi:MAG: hypothetical protein IPJ07_09505 [Acidobacteria bacterium]|nr:hypothetical protein [Acidobacteriota bacterium]